MATTLIYRTEAKSEKNKEKIYTRMWANAQRNGRPAECRQRPLFNVANSSAVQ